MQKQQTTSKAPAAKNYTPDVKKVAWAYVVTALLYLLAGGPPVLGFLYLMMTFFACVVIFQNSDKNEQAAIASVMVAFLVINAGYMALPHDGRPVPPENLLMGPWLINKLLYVFGLALFVPVLVDPWVHKKERRQSRQTWAIFGALTMQFALGVFMFYERQHESHATVQCEKVVEMVCTPKALPSKPWYTPATAAEDLVFGLQVALLMAAFSSKKEEPVLEDEKN